MADIYYEPFAKQIPFHESKAFQVYLSSGFGGGKTYSLVMKMFQLMDANRGLPGGLLCPDTKMYKRDVLPIIRNVCDENNIRQSYNKTELTWYFPDTDSIVYVFHSQDDGDSIKGPNLAWMLINEVTLVSEMAYNIAISRVRIKRAKQLQIGMSGTPEGFNWAYERLINPEKPVKNLELLYGNSADNPYNSDNYIQTLRDSYDELMQEQYIEGKFVNLVGKRCAYAFDRFKHTDSDIDKLSNYPVLVSLDFNVTPMAATLWNRMPGIISKPDRTKQKAVLRAFDEICINSSNTYEMCQAIKEKTLKTDQVIIYPDPAGSARSTKTRGTTDIDILIEHGFHDIRYKSRINVRNCLNALNNMLNKNLILMDREKCRNTIADLEQCIFKGNVFEIDKSNPKRTHWLDGIKNMIEYEFPIAGVRGFREERIR